MRHSKMRLGGHYFGKFKLAGTIESQWTLLSTEENESADTYVSIKRTLIKRAPMKWTPIKRTPIPISKSLNGHRQKGHRFDNQ